MFNSIPILFQLPFLLLLKITGRRITTSVETMTITAIRLNQPMLSKGTSNTSIPACVKMQHRISSSLSLVLGRETSDLVSICQMTRDGRHLERNMDSSRKPPPYRRDSHQSLSLFLPLCSLSRSSRHVWSLVF